MNNDIIEGEIVEAIPLDNQDTIDEDSARINKIADDMIPDSEKVCPIDWDKVKTIKDIKIIINGLFGAIPYKGPTYEEIKGYLKKPMHIKEFQYYECELYKKKKRKKK